MFSCILFAIAGMLHSSNSWFKRQQVEEHRRRLHYPRLGCHEVVRANSRKQEFCSVKHNHIEWTYGKIKLGCQEYFVRHTRTNSIRFYWQIWVLGIYVFFLGTKYSLRPLIRCMFRNHILMSHGGKWKVDHRRLHIISEIKLVLKVKQIFMAIALELHSEIRWILSIKIIKPMLESSR